MIFQEHVSLLLRIIILHFTFIIAGAFLLLIFLQTTKN